MNRFASIFVALGLATAGTPALADQAIGQLDAETAKPQPVQMTDAQLDNVAAGQVNVGEGLIVIQVGEVLEEVETRILNNSLNNNDVTVQVPVAASIGAAVAVLGNAAAIAQQLGRQRLTD